MPYRINHIHLKSPDPRQTAEWYVRAFNFTIVNDETRVFGDRFVRCMSEGGGLAVNISGARTGEKLGPGDANPHHGLEHFGFRSTSRRTSRACRASAPRCSKAPSRIRTAGASPFCAGRTIRG